MLVHASATRPGWEPIYINKEEAEFTHSKSGNANKLWLGFQPYFDKITSEEPDTLD